ncbi:MAG: GLPGLI family protein [Cruoricaptor ignavus]|nr:GLPGLI family protein [Cruoricaptor ignavus]
MKKVSIFILSILSGILLSQNTRFVYEVTMKSDSTASPTIENAYLDVSGDKSVFYGENRLKRDSVMQRAFQTRTFNFDRSQMEQFRTLINYQIDKNISEQKVTFKNRIGRDLYAYDEDRALSWKILLETSVIGDYKVQKAETDFAGRKWQAWFTQDVPMMDGPYKFYGLPGLIVKIEDSQNHYSFDLKETKSIAELPNLQQMGNTVAVKRKDYDKQMEKYRKDPMATMQSGMMQGPPSGGRGGAGNAQNDAERRKRMQERIEQEIKKNNNPLEKN